VNYTALKMDNNVGRIESKIGVLRAVCKAQVFTTHVHIKP